MRDKKGEWMGDGPQKEVEDLAVALYQKVSDWSRSSPLSSEIKTKLLTVAVGAFVSAFMRNLLDAQERQDLSEVITRSANDDETSGH
jgi:hypothetical protein